MKVIFYPKLFLKIEIDRNIKNGTINISQDRYVEKILKLSQMKDSNPIRTPLEKNLKIVKGNQEIVSEQFS